MQITQAIIIVPGWRNSAVGSWQSLCAAQLPDAVWVTHSLGCFATAHLPADPERRAILGDFALTPGQRLRYRHAPLGHDNHLH